MNEDYDIKIFSPVKKAETPEKVTIADEMKRQVISGNVQKARALGKKIAESFKESADKNELFNVSIKCGIKEFTRAVKDQAIILSVFAAEYMLSNYIKDPILSTTAISELYDTLTEDSPALYGKLLSSTAFSFYYMNIDADNISTEVIGKTFAVLCDDDNNESLFCYGKTVFEMSCESYKAEIDTTNLN